MIENRYINIIIIVLVAVALIFTGIFTFYPSLLGIKGDEKNPAYADELFPKDEVISIEISADKEAWQKMLEEATNEQFISCDITINGKTYKSVGIRPKGNSSLQTVASSESDRFSFKIKFDEYVDKQTCYGLREMVINNMQGDATYMKEYLSYDLFEYMGVDSPLHSFANISVNDEEWGLYLAVETIDEEFAQRVYGKNHGELYKPESQDIGGGGKGMPGGRPQGMKNVSGSAIGRPEGMPEGMRPDMAGNTSGGAMAGPPEGFEITSGGAMVGPPEWTPSRFPGSDSGGGADLVYKDDNYDSYKQIFDNAVFKASDSDKNKIIKALKALSKGENLEEYVNTDEVLRYFAVNTALVNCDSYICSFKHNYYLYEKDGVISILPWDLNLSFAGFQTNNSTDAVNFPIDTPVTSGLSLSERPLIGTLLNDEQYMEKYHDYLKKIATDYFENGYFEAEIERLDKLINEYVKNDKTTFFSYEQYLKGVDTLKEFGKLRALSISGQIDGSVPSTEDTQKKNTESLIDASGINISDMGSQGGRDREGVGVNGKVKIEQ